LFISLWTQSGNFWIHPCKCIALHPYALCLNLVIFYTIYLVNYICLVETAEEMGTGELNAKSRRIKEGSFFQFSSCLCSVYFFCNMNVRYFLETDGSVDGGRDVLSLVPGP